MIEHEDHCPRRQYWTNCWGPPCTCARVRPSSVIRWVLFALLLWSLVALAIFVPGCEQNSGLAGDKQPDDVNGLELVKFDGHEYLLWRGANRGGIVHNEGCPCRGEPKGERP